MDYIGLALAVIGLLVSFVLRAPRAWLGPDVIQTSASVADPVVALSARRRTWSFFADALTLIGLVLAIVAVARP